MQQPIQVLLVFGTRPEAIKMCPLYLHLKADARFAVRCCVTAQHRSMLDSVLSVFGVTPDYDLNAMTPGQTLPGLTARLLEALDEVIATSKPDIVLVQGDTTSTFVGALAAFYRRVAVGHVEAGLRTGDIYQPYPEEMNRLLVSRLATLHFPPTAESAANLTSEGTAPERVFVTGNTGIDAVFRISGALERGELNTDERIELNPNAKTILVTCHRRESFGAGLEQICQALLRLAAREDVELIVPVHHNPNVRSVFQERLGGHANIRLLEPLSYVPFVDLMRRSYLLITDSGGIQEEGPSLGKPILVLREKTERPEAVAAGTVILVGTDPERIFSQASRLLDNPDAYAAMTRRYNPYGDGQACGRIAEALAGYFARIGSGS